MHYFSRCLPMSLRSSPYSQRKSFKSSQIAFGVFRISFHPFSVTTTASPLSFLLDCPISTCSCAGASSSLSVLCVSCPSFDLFFKFPWNCLFHRTVSLLFLPSSSILCFFHQQCAYYILLYTSFTPHTHVYRMVTCNHFTNGILSMLLCTHDLRHVLLRMCLRAHCYRGDGVCVFSVMYCMYNPRMKHHNSWWQAL